MVDDHEEGGDDNAYVWDWDARLWGVQEKYDFDKLSLLMMS